MSLERILPRLAEETGAAVKQIVAAVELLDGGATVPFIARYRKEVTGGLDDIQLRLLEERLRYHRELEDRRAMVLATIEVIVPSVETDWREMEISEEESAAAARRSSRSSRRSTRFLRFTSR